MERRSYLNTEELVDFIDNLLEKKMANLPSYTNLHDLFRDQIRSVNLAGGAFTFHFHNGMSYSFPIQDSATRYYVPNGTYTTGISYVGGPIYPSSTTNWTITSNTTGER